MQPVKPSTDIESSDALRVSGSGTAGDPGRLSPGNEAPPEFLRTHSVTAAAWIHRSEAPAIWGPLPSQPTPGDALVYKIISMTMV